MRLPVFLSCPRPHTQLQQDFLDAVTKYLTDQGLNARTLGVTDYNISEPLNAIRRMLIESHGIITLAFRRTMIRDGEIRDGTDLPGVKSEKINGLWLTSPYSHIEAAMAFQIGLPTLIWREQGVLADGLLERGVTGLYLPEFNLDLPTPELLAREEWHQLFLEWAGYVRQVAQNKGRPPKLY
jgi:hypothetical protein